MPIHTKPSADLQRAIDQVEAMGNLTLRPPRGEFQGPIVIRRPLTLNGQGGTIWSPVGPVLIVESEGVELHDVNIEVTSNEHDLEGPRGCALIVRGGHAPQLNAVSVRGNVSGMQTEEGDWWYPRSLRLGKPIAGRSHEYKIRVVVPVPCQFRSEIDGLSVSPSGVKAGPCEVTIRLESLAAGTRLRGTLAICSAFLIRRISVTGAATRSSTDTGDTGKGQVIWEPVDWAALTSASSPSLPTERKQTDYKTPKTTTTGKRARRALGGDEQKTARKKSDRTPKHIPTKLASEKTEKKADSPKIADGFSAETTETNKGSGDRPAPLTPPSPKITSIPIGNAWSSPPASHPSAPDNTACQPSSDQPDADDIEEEGLAHEETVSAAETSPVSGPPSKKRKSTPLSGVFGPVQPEGPANTEERTQCSEGASDVEEGLSADEPSDLLSGARKKRKMVRANPNAGLFTDKPDHNR